MTLFERVFNGNDAVYGLTEQAIDAAIAQHGEEKAVSFPNTAYCLPCYYAVTGVKVTNLKELKEALGVVKTLMTREPRLNDAFMSRPVTLQGQTSSSSQVFRTDTPSSASSFTMADPDTGRQLQ